MSLSQPQQSDGFNPLRDCARKGCTRHCRDGGDARLERISPKPGPFLGLCQDHYGVPPIVLKRGAQEVMLEISLRAAITAHAKTGMDKPDA